MLKHNPKQKEVGVANTRFDSLNMKRNHNFFVMISLNLDWPDYKVRKIISRNINSIVKAAQLKRRKQIKLARSKITIQGIFHTVLVPYTLVLHLYFLLSKCSCCKFIVSK